MRKRVGIASGVVVVVLVAVLALVFAIGSNTREQYTEYAQELEGLRDDVVNSKPGSNVRITERGIAIREHLMANPPKNDELEPARKELISLALFSIYLGSSAPMKDDGVEGEAEFNECLADFDSSFNALDKMLSK